MKRAYGATSARRRPLVHVIAIGPSTGLRIVDHGRSSMANRKSTIDNPEKAPRRTRVPEAVTSLAG